MPAGVHTCIQGNDHARQVNDEIGTFVSCVPLVRVFQCLVFLLAGQQRLCIGQFNALIVATYTSKAHEYGQVLGE